MSANGEIGRTEITSDHVECAAFDDEFSKYRCSSVRNKEDKVAVEKYSDLEEEKSDERYKKDSVVQDNNLNVLCDLLKHEVRWRHGHPWYNDM